MAVSLVQADLLGASNQQWSDAPYLHTRDFFGIKPTAPSEESFNTYEILAAAILVIGGTEVYRQIGTYKTGDRLLVIPFDPNVFMVPGYRVALRLLTSRRADVNADFNIYRSHLDQTP